MRPHKVSRWCILAVGLAVGLLTGCGDSAAPSADTSVTIAATIYPLADLTEQLVGDNVEVVCLLPPGISPHGFSVNADQMNALRKSKLLVMIGMGFDSWASQARDAAGNRDLQVFQMAKAVGIENAGEHEEHDEHEDHSACTHHDHGGSADPHLWLDPALVQKMLPQLINTLAKALPDQAQVIRDNGKKLTQQLNQLDQDYAKQLASVKSKKLVTFHGAFNRLAERYGLEVAATLMPVESPGGVTSGQYEKVMAAISTHQLKVLFTEPQFSPDAAKQISRKTGVKILTLDPLGDPNIPDRAGYLPMMRYNLKTLTEGLNLMIFE